MIHYIIRRFFLYLFTVVFLLFVLFMLGQNLPLDSLVSVSGVATASPKEVASLTQIYHLNDSWWMQCYSFINQRLRGEFGVSMVSQVKVIDELLMLLPATLELLISAAIIGVSLGITLGIVLTLTNNQWVRTLLIFISINGYSLPIFWFGIGLSVLVGDVMQWLPTAGRINLIYDFDAITGFYVIDSLLSTSAHREYAFFSVVEHLALPALTLGLYPMTYMLRITYMSLSEVMKSNYIKAAQARGMRTSRILRVHALPNAANVLVRRFTMMLGTLVSYLVITEVVYSWPGIGTWLLRAVTSQDYTVIHAGIFFISFFIITINILIDVLYLFINPLLRKEIYDAY
jgi:cationic peptide transport system permease protein